MPSDVKFEIGHVLFIDIVGYSKLLITEQSFVFLLVMAAHWFSGLTRKRQFYARWR